MQDNGSNSSVLVRSRLPLSTAYGQAHNQVTRDLALILKLNNLIANPKFTGHIRRRLVVGLRLLDASAQARLACDYAEHLVWICEEAFPRDQRFQQAITKTKQFLGGETTIALVAQARSRLYDAHYELRQHHNIAGEASSSITLAIRVCCQRELEALGAVMRTRFQPRVDGVATSASYAVARYIGGEDWDSDEPKLKAAARKRGKAASDAETEWQMNRLLEAMAA